MNSRIAGTRTIRTFGMGLTMQALLSGANFAVGLILIRRTSDLQYSYYVLATNALLLLTAMQTAFIQPYVVSNLTTLDSAARHDVVGALVRTSSRWVPVLCGISIAVAWVLWGAQRLHPGTALLVTVCLLAGGLALSREFFRVTLFAYRRPADVLQADLAFVVLLIAGAFLATLTGMTATAAMIGVGLANLMGFLLLRRALWRYEPWSTHTTGHIMGKIAAAGAWAILGSGIHWLLIQGYSYLVAGVLDISDVASIAATRLMLMPVFVLSGGVSMLLFPMTSRWVHELGTRAASRRLLMLVATLGGAALVYMVTMWLLRDWIFTVILKKQFTHRDPLLLLWSAVFLVTLCRDQLATLPASRARFRDMTLMTGVSAIVWLLTSYLAMLRYGPSGAVMGILAGEFINICGIIFMVFKETRSHAAVPAH
ncbi:MAG: lipopolysaccharide biosynthesis protein [Steroidobacteraceae bacterium]